MTRPGFHASSQPDLSAPEVRATCRNCVDHECGLYYAACGCCAAWAGTPGDVTLGAAALQIRQPARPISGGAS